MCVQLAQGLLDHIDILTGGGSEDSDPFIDLEDLLKLYGLTLPDCRECESKTTRKSASMQVAQCLLACPVLESRN